MNETTPRFQVKDEWETIRILVETRASIARYGDGEFNIAVGGNAKAQLGSPVMAQRLRDILKSNSPCLVGIPNMYNGNTAAPDTKQHSFWGNMANRRHYDCLMDPAKQYYSSFITRPDNAVAINTVDYFEYCRQLWNGRRVVVVTGQGVPFCKDEGYLGNCETISTILGPAVNAWSEYKQLFKRCLVFDKDMLFLLRLGPTATVLAFDLCHAGYQALDLGHFGMFARRFREGNQEQDYDNTKTGKDFLNAGKA
jgi:glycosyltransferase family protein